MDNPIPGWDWLGQGSARGQSWVIVFRWVGHRSDNGHWHVLPQVPQDEWSGGFSPLGKDEEIPCRRMRSGSYIKAMAEEDSGESDCSPKPSPKVQARRASYLKATQPSLTEMTTLK